MSARILSSNEEEIVVELRISRSKSFIDCENTIQDELNAAGKLASEKCLEDFDTDGSPIIVAGTTLTAKKQRVSKKYQSPFGEITVPRFAYQSSFGGVTEIPLEQNARIVGSSTPRMARLVSFKYAESNAGQVVKDAWESHRLNLSRCYIQNVSAAMAREVMAKDPYWRYTRTENEPLPINVATVSIGIDGTCMLFCDEGYRQAMVGTLAFFDAAGERLHTIYVAAAPEHGKATFLERMDEEIARVKLNFAEARYVAITDGATDFVPWLKAHTTTQILDFWHAAEYIKPAAAALHRSSKAREQWTDDACHRLKHEHGAAKAILKEFEAVREKRLAKKTRKDLEAAISYFGNNLGRMNYASYRKSHVPIGSGVTEAACKTVVKQRLCGSGMKWKHSGADDVLTLRAITRSDGAWDAFWKRLDKFGTSKRKLAQTLNQFGPEEIAPLMDGLLAFCETKTGTINKELYELAEIVRRDPLLAQRLHSEEGNRELWESGILAREHGDFQQRFMLLLRNHGHREIDFDLYQPVWAEVPWVVLDMVRLILDAPDEVTPAQRERELKIRSQAAEFSLFQRLPEELHFFFHEIIRLARNYTSLDDLEHYQTTRLALPLRKGLKMLGQRLVERGILIDPMDIFFARETEIDAAVAADSPAKWKALSSAIDREKISWLEARDRSPGWVPDAPENEFGKPEPGTELSGFPGSPGQVEGEVYVVSGPQDFAGFPRGAILVARTTNPAWTPLFYTASAVITESGGPLSHGAVTAREMRIPAVMAVRECLSRLSNGCTVRVDGSTGKVVILNSEAEAIDQIP